MSNSNVKVPFNPQDPQYQIHPSYPPNKGDTWTMKVEDDGWILIHNCLRSETQRLRRILLSLSSNDALLPWQVNSLKYIFHIHFQTVHGHHTNEDEILTPFLKKRFAYPNKMTDDHSDIIHHINSLHQKLGNFSGSQSDLQQISETFTLYEQSLLPHLEEEEQVGLVLMRAYFTQKEIRPVIAKILARTQKLEPFTVGFMIHSLGEIYVRQVMMKQEGIPFFVWYLIFKPQMKKFQKLVLVHYNALETAVAPHVKQQKRIQKILQETNSNNEQNE